ncbi:MAG: cyclic nucleotide-binding domain-containing protein [Chloroflexi bacterium]|nr:cyclic nucleotide-binding domain-containing protein [Chloroflexota bacterium]
MMMQITRAFLTFRRIPAHIVIATAGASILLTVGMFLLGQPLYMMALFALLPWLPVLLFESLWKVDHYHWVAVFAVIVVLQLGHLMEHVVQVAVLSLTNAPLVCPPPVDTAENAQRAIQAGLRDPGSAPTGMSVSTIVKPNAQGTALIGADGAPVTTPLACGIFGQLDLEIVHLIWEVAGWMLILMLVLRYPRNIWLWIALAFASVHTVEHLFICYTFFFDNHFIYEGTRQLWGTVADGNLVTAVPLGTEPAMLNFYDVAGKNGIAARGGLIGTFFPDLNPLLPTRPYLHFYYNLIVTVPLAIAFAGELRRVSDRYLRRAMPQLTTKEAARITPALHPVRFRAGETIVRQGEPASRFYIITRGEVEVIAEQPDGGQEVITRLGQGEFFGEVGLLRDGVRHATVRAQTAVELLCMERSTFDTLISRAEVQQDIEHIARLRDPSVRPA